MLLPSWGSVEDRRFKLPPTEVMFSSVDLLISVLVVVAELESIP